MNDSFEPSSRRPPRRGIRWLLTAIIVVLGALVSAALIYTGPTTERIEETRPPKVVRTVSIEPRTEAIRVTAYGVVIPAREVSIEPEVRGRVVRLHPSLVAGGRIAAGEELIGIETADYDIALAEKKAAREEAQFEIAVERGRQVVASREWTLLKGDLPERDANRSLALREPHLKRAEALLDRANNQIEQAELDLSRTTIACPFNAVVLSEQVEIGQLVDPGSTVCTLAGSDEFWVRVSVPIDKLRWIRLPDGDAPGAAAEVCLDIGNGPAPGRSGEVLRLLGDLETEGRMARIIVVVPNPLETDGRRQALPLLLGSYVRVEIDAGELHDILPIPRAALREGNRIWVVGPKHELEIRDAKVLWSRRETVLVDRSSMRDDEDLIVSGLRTALPQMKVSPQRE